MDYMEELMNAYCMLEDIRVLEGGWGITKEESEAFDKVESVIGRAMLRRTNDAVFRKDGCEFLTEQKMEDFKLYFAKAKEAMRQRDPNCKS